MLPGEGIDPSARYVKTTHKGEVAYSDIEHKEDITYTMAEACSFSPFVLEFLSRKPVEKLRDSRGGSPASPARTEASRWMRDSVGWWYKNEDGTWPSDCWVWLTWNGSGQWYRFNVEGYMVTGWYQDTDGNQYFLHNISDGSQGYMYTGWHQIDGKWYYFRENEGGPAGSLLTGGTTPDGYKTDAQGVWTE